MSSKNKQCITLNVDAFKINPYESLFVVNGVHKTVKFFDKNWVLRELPKEEAYKKKIKGCTRTKKDGLYIYKVKPGIEIGDNNNLLFSKVIRRSNEGDTYEEFIERCRNIRFKGESPYSWIERFIAKINLPIIEGVKPSSEGYSFDSVRVCAHINRIDDSDIKQAIKQNLGDIDSMIKKKIKEYKPFEKYDINVDSLNISSIGITRRDEMIVVYKQSKE